MNGSWPLWVAEVSGCSRCFPEGNNRPVVAPNPKAAVALIGQAPSRTDWHTGRMFSGPGGRRLREWLEGAGLPEERVHLTALVKCYPGRHPAGRGDLPPSRPMLAHCWPHLLQELRLLNPCGVLLVGGVAVRVFLGQRRLTEAVGKVFSAEESPPLRELWGHQASRRWVVPLPHCSGASLWLNVKEHRGLLERALRAIRECYAASCP